MIKLRYIIFGIIIVSGMCLGAIPSTIVDDADKNKQVRAVALIDEAGNQVGTSTNRLYIQGGTITATLDGNDNKVKILDESNAQTGVAGNRLAVDLFDNTGSQTATSVNPVFMRDFLLEAQKGNITGYSGENKFSRNIEVDSSVTADIWDGGHTVASGGVSLIWVAPTAARIHTIASTSANDTTGGTGANSVRINYLPDWDTAEAGETVTGDLNAGIAMTNASVMINRMEVIIQSTSTIINDGIITATAATDGTITSQIRVGQGQTQQSMYGLPSTQKAFIGRLYSNTNKAGGASGLVDIVLLANTAPDVNTIPFITKHTFGLQTVGTSALTINFYIPKVIDGPAIIKIQAISSTNDMDISAGYDFVLANN